MHPSPGYVLGLWPDATPLELSDGGASPALDEIVQGPSAALTAVALVVGQRARASGWAARAALTIARHWRGPRRIVLMDLDLERPALHEAAGLTIDEGVVDMLDFGLSLGSVRREVAAGGFDVVTTGLYAADAGALLRHDDWSRVLLEAAAQWSTLLVWVPASAEGMDAVVERAGAVLVLADAAEAEAVVGALRHPYSVLAVLTPAAVDASEGLVEEVEPIVSAAAADEVLQLVDDVSEPVVVAAAAEEVLESAQAPGQADPVHDEPGTSGGGRLTEADFERIRLPTERAARQALILELRDRQRAARMARPAPLQPHAASREPVSSDAVERAVTPEAEIVAATMTKVGSVHMPASGSEHAREMRLEGAADDVNLDSLDPGITAAAATPPRRPRPLTVAGPPPQQPSRYRRPLVWTLAVVLLLSLLAGAWHFLSGRLGWGSGVGTEAEQDAALTAPPPPPAPVLREVALPYAVAMEAYRDVAAATERVETLRAAEAGITFHVAPLEREGTLYYHVMAGPVPDSMAARAVRDTLLARRHKTTMTPNDVRYAPLAFLVGDYGSRFMAQEQMLELRRLDVPSYMLLADAEDGEPLYRVYVGGFATAVESEIARQLLRAAGVRDSLVTRTGSIVQ
jgi:hypothetical protein